MFGECLALLRFGETNVTSSGITRRRLAQTAGALGLVLATVIGLTVACNQGTPGGGSNENSAPGPLFCSIINIPGNFQIQVGTELPLTVIYNVDAAAENVRGFYVAVAGSAADAPEIGDDVIVAENLLPGEGHTFTVQLAAIPAGFYRVGIRGTKGGSEGRCTSSGTLELTSGAQPEFTQPFADVAVDQGDDVQVGFDVHDPAGSVQWRLFYISTNGPFDTAADEIGTLIRTGTGNSAPVLWNTGGVDLGVYFVGLSTTASGQSVADTVAAGNAAAVRTILDPFTITVQEPTAPPSATSPLIEVTQPSSRVPIPLGKPGEFVVQFTGTIRVSNPINPKIDVYLDRDNRPGSGNEIPVALGLAPDARSAVVNTEQLAEATYYVYARINDGVSTAVTDYAPGRLEVASNVPTLTVAKPDSAMSVAPGTAVPVEWQTTNIASDAAKVDVFRRAMGSNNQPTGAEIAILASTNGAITKATFVAAESGVFQISVRYKFTDTSISNLVATAPSLVRVSTLPLVMWVGDLADYDPDVQSQPSGAVFEGHNFEDNAGSAFTGGEDFNADGIDDFVMVARYAKPEFINPSGIGEGEAYLIRGKTSRYQGSYDVNQVGTAQIPGVVMSGIPTPIDLTFTPPRTTYGIASVFLATDADGDGVGELIFGFPYASSNRRDSNDLTAPLVFQNGGVVILSSQNTAIQGQGTSDSAGRRIRLQDVGQNFEERNVAPEPDDGRLCANDSSWMADFYAPHTGECPTAGTCTATPDANDEPTDGTCSEDGSQCDTSVNPPECPPKVPVASFGGCLPNTDSRVSPDGIYDTLIQPAHGFDRYRQLAFDFVNYYAGRNDGFFPCTVYPNVVSGSTPGHPFPCPTCWDNSLDGGPNPENPIPCTCAQFVSIFRLWYVNLDERAGSIEFCNTVTGDWSSGDPYALQVPEPIECADQNADILRALGLRQPLVDRGGDYSGIRPNPYIRSGFYRDRIAGAETASNVDWNDPTEPLGAWIIGRPRDTLVAPPAQVHEEFGAFGSSIAQSGNELIISAPARDVIAGNVFVNTNGESEYLNDVAELEGGAAENEDAGVAYLFTNIDLWGSRLTDGCPVVGAVAPCPTQRDANIPPKPHVYSAGGGGHTGTGQIADCSGSSGLPPTASPCRRDLILERNISGVGPVWGGLAIAGRPSEKIENILGIPDFNRDSRPDFVVGAPEANSGDGVAYVAFRRATSLEGDYVLGKLALATSDPDRLAGVYITGNASEGGQLGASLAGGNPNKDGKFDFNGDGFDDLAIGSPTGNSGTGEVLIVFSSNQLVTPLDGLTVDALLAQGKAALITGSQADSRFGLNVANAGDIDGDGKDDLLIAAPNATPRFDTNPFDSTDQLNSNGLDRNLDGKMDDVSGPQGVPDGRLGPDDQLEHAGVVYVIFSSLNANSWTGNTISISQLGKAKLPGFMIVGRRAEYQLGGGDAQTANADKAPSLSHGLFGVGDVDGDGKSDFMIGSILADPRVDPQTGEGTLRGGEAYLIYGFSQTN
jgi:hypothetical protein